MDSVFKVDAHGGGAILSLAIALESHEVGHFVVASLDNQKMNPQDLLKTYDQFGLDVLLACMRSYVIYARHDEENKKRRKLNTQRKLKAKSSKVRRRIRVGANESIN